MIDVADVPTRPLMPKWLPSLCENTDHLQECVLLVHRCIDYQGFYVLVLVTTSLIKPAEFS